MVGILLVAAACADSGSPTTAPVATTGSDTTTTVPPTATSTLAPTTTLGRLAEVQAIVQDLEERRLDALFREDEEAFRALFANVAYLELSLEVLGNLEFVAEPTDIDVEVSEILAETEDCLAVEVVTDLTQALGPDALVTQTLVLEKLADGWGYSYGGTGWVCSGPHPLER